MSRNDNAQTSCEGTSDTTYAFPAHLLGELDAPAAEGVEPRVSTVDGPPSRSALLLVMRGPKPVPSSCSINPSHLRAGIRTATSSSMTSPSAATTSSFGWRTDNSCSSTSTASTTRTSIMNRSTPRCWSTATRSRSASVPEFVALALGIYYDSGSLSFASGRLGILTALFDRLGRHEPAAIISGFADAPVALATFPEIAEATVHLRQVFGDETYESFAQAGANMTNAAKAAYALDQIDLARADLLRVEESP